MQHNVEAWRNELASLVERYAANRAEHITFLMSELAGRSYGGGVLTFEPSEARSLPIPFSTWKVFR